MLNRKRMPTNEPVKGASNPTSAGRKSRGIFGNRRRRSRRHLKEERNDKSDTSQKVEDGQHDCEKMSRDSASRTCSPCDIVVNVPASIRISNTTNTNNLQISIDTFLRDVQALFSSPEMSRLVHSSSQLLHTAAEAAFHISLLPVTIPMDVAQSATSVVVNTVGQSCDMVGAVFNGAVPVAVGVTETIVSSVAGMVCPLFGFNETNGKIMLSEEERESCSTTQCSQTASTRSHSDGEESCGASVSDTFTSSSSLAASATASTALSHDDLTMFYSFSPEKGKSDERSSPTSSQAFASSSRKLRRGVSSFMRICDLQLQDGYLEIHPDFPPDALSASAIDALTARGFALATHDNLCSNNNPQLPRWQPEGSTTRLLRRASESEAHFTRILEKEVLLWHARMDSSIQYGLNVPIFKSQGIVNMDPKSFTELLMDSDRVQTYNRYSGGRTDEVVLQRGIESYSKGFGVGETKIVRSENKIPFASNSVVLWNLMHARRLEGCDDESYIIVSRSVSRTGRGAQDQISEIVWGVNVLKGVKGHLGKTDLTCVSQVGQTMVPGFVQHKLALAALCEVYKSTRALCK